MTVSGNGQSCPHCGATRGPDDIFCESCGADFLTGAPPPPPPGPPAYTNLTPVPGQPAQPDVSRTAPTERAPWADIPPVPSQPVSTPSAPPPPPPSSPVPSAPPSGPVSAPSAPPSGPVSVASAPPSVQSPPPVQSPPSVQAPPSVQSPPPVQTPPSVPQGEVPPGQVPVIPIPPAPPRLRFELSVDRAYFDVAVAEGELAWPDPPAPAKELERTGTELHIGRTSESRNIHPDIDVADLTGDPAVSSRQAVIRVSTDGRVTVTDVGSTNGTVVGAVEAPAIPSNVEVTVEEGTPIYVGAWTRLVFHRA